MIRIHRMLPIACSILLGASPVFVFSQVERSSTAATSAPAAAETGAIAGRVKNAADQRNLDRALVVVVGTELVAFSDATGSYILVGVPPGRHAIEVQYTGLDVRRATVEVSAGVITELNVELSSRLRYGNDTGTVKLDPFTVSADRDLNAQTSATNEQRYAANIKNVLSTDEFGSMVANSVGEFMKFMPGIAVDYSGNEITGFSVRGIGGAMTNFSQDGNPMVFGSYVRSTRIFNPYTSDINSAAQIEVTKVPTPATPADSIGGSINLVTKSAFDFDRAVGSYNLGLNTNRRYLRTPRASATWGDKINYKYQPFASIDYRVPVSKTFGFFVSALYSPRPGNNENYRTAYTNSGTGTGASISAPYLQQVLELDDPRIYTKKNISFKADWKPAPRSVVTANFSYGQNRTLIGDGVRQITVGAIGTPTVASGRSLVYGDTYTNGATGRGNVQLQHLFQRFGGGTKAGSLSYRFDDGTWKISTQLNASQSWMQKDNPGGPFTNIIAQTVQPLRINLTGAGFGRRPATVQAFDNNDRPVDIGDIANYSITAGQDIFYKNTAQVGSADLKVKRRLQWFSFPASLEIGGNYADKRYVNRGWVKNLTYNGPDGNAATIDPIPASFLMQVYQNQSSFAGGAKTPFLSPHRVWAAWVANPNLFSMTTAQAVTLENNRRQTSGDLDEGCAAGYLQGDARLFNGRLTILGGVRFEKTTDHGKGPLIDPNAVWVRNANGTFAHDAGGARIRRPEAGVVGSLDELNLTTKELAARSAGTYQGAYPSLHTTYQITESVMLRAAYAKTFGRPDFLTILPGTTINQNDLTTNPSAVPGTISVSNTALKPWSANNYDLSLEYYSADGGMLSVGGYQKDLKQFFIRTSTIATQADLDLLALDSQYLGWNITSTFNGGDAKVSGVEFNARQSLSRFGRWGRFFLVFANGTKLHIEGARNADFSMFVRESVNWGVSFRSKRVYTALKFNYRGLDKRTPDSAFGDDGWVYFKPSVTVDADAAYTLTSRLSLSLSISNVTNSSRTTWLDYGSATPAYARPWIKFNTGAQYVLTLRGTF